MFIIYLLWGLDWGSGLGIESWPKEGHKKPVGTEHWNLRFGYETGFLRGKGMKKERRHEDR